MDALELLKERRSVRKFKEERVSKSVMDEILEVSSLAPSWGNSQTARFNVINDEELINKIASEGYGDFDFNTKTLLAATGVMVISYVNGFSGHAPNGELASTKGDAWGFFDAALAAQQFSLAAYEKGIGSVIQGIFDEKKVAELLNLPENEIVACIIPFGYEIEGKHSKAPKRKSVEEISRYF